MKTGLAVIITIVVILIGYYSLKEGIDAFRKDEKSIGPYIPKSLFFIGISILGGVIFGLIRLLISHFTK